MGNHMKFCRCRACRSGLHRGGGSTVKAIIRKFRRKAKAALKQGKDPDNKISVPYTD